MQVTQTRTEAAFCPAITRGGNRCGRRIAQGADFCHLHDPARAEERRRISSRAGKSKPLSESAHLRRQLSELIEEVRSGDTDPKIANAVAVLANSIIGTLRLDMKIRELEDIEVRLRNIEKVAGSDGPENRIEMFISAIRGEDHPMLDTVRSGTGKPNPDPFARLLRALEGYDESMPREDEPTD